MNCAHIYALLNNLSIVNKSSSKSASRASLRRISDYSSLSFSKNSAYRNPREECRLSMRMCLIYSFLAAINRYLCI